MSTQLRLLIVEDSEDDTLLLVRELRKAGYAVEYERVDNPEAMKTALGRPWDLIVADYVLPLFSGPAALKMVREWGIDLPFIILSGNIGEDVAVEAMKAGAHDYISKSNMKRLVPAVERELREARLRREGRSTEKALEVERQRFDEVLETLPVLVALITPDYHVSFANRLFRARFGEAQGRRCFEYCFGQGSEPCEFCRTHEVVETGRPCHWEYALPDGRHYDIHDYPFADAGGAPLILKTCIDVTERKLAESALRDTNRLLQLFTVQSSKKEYLDSVVGLLREWTGCEAIGLRVLDKEANIPYESYVGFSDEFRQAESSISPERDRCICPRVVAGTPDACDLPYMTPNGSFHCEDTMAFLATLTDEAKARFRGRCMADGYVSLSVIPVSYRNSILGAIHLADRRKAMVSKETVGFIESIEPLIGEALHRLNVEEERERLEAQLRQAQKLEALGTLAGGIAHDFNNILAAIIGFSEIVKDHLPKENRELRHVQMVLDAGIRGRDLVRQMLTFSRQAEQEKKPLRLSGIVKETVKLLRASIPTTVSIRTSVKSESGVILGDPVQIQQIVMNLATNAAYAMRGKGGLLDIELSDFSVSRANGNPHGLEPGTYVKLVVRDTGTGMPPGIMEKIFDPFFTTKARGEGTGLGMSVVMGIVKQSRGYITAESEVGKGSVFTIYFPKAEQKPVPEAAGREPIPTGTERVLFVDDEEALVEMGEELLTELGYEVTCRTGSRETLALFAQDPSRFDLVITDQTMPDMTGLELAREIMVLRPDTPVILCTGFSHSVSQESARAAGIRAFAMKPLTKREIARTVRQVLDA